MKILLLVSLLTALGTLAKKQPVQNRGVAGNP